MGYEWPVRKEGLKRKTPLRRQKFNAPRYKAGPHVHASGFGSKLEAAVYQRLEAREKAGEIRELKQQVRVELVAGINWNVDFSYFDIAEGRMVWAEAKGVKTPRYVLCLKLWKAGFGPGPLEIWTGEWEDPRRSEIVIPKEK